MKKFKILFLSVSMALAVSGASAMTLSPEKVPSAIKTKASNCGRCLFVPHMLL